MPTKPIIGDLSEQTSIRLCAGASSLIALKTCSKETNENQTVVIQKCKWRLHRAAGLSAGRKDTGPRQLAPAVWKKTERGARLQERDSIFRFEEQETSLTKVESYLLLSSDPYPLWARFVAKGWRLAKPVPDERRLEVCR